MPTDHTGLSIWQREGYLFRSTCCLVLERSQVSRQRWRLVQLYFPLSSVFLRSRCSYLKRDNAHAAKQQFKGPFTLKLNFRYVHAETLEFTSTFTEQDLFIRPLVSLLLLRVLFSYLCTAVPSCIVRVDDSCII